MPFSADTEDYGIGICGWLLVALSWLMVALTFPLSICFCLKVRKFFKNFSKISENFWKISEKLKKNKKLRFLIKFEKFQVVQEYERAVIFRLGRLIGGGAKGPGIFFVLPCIESYTKVDLRTVSFDVPPQEVQYIFFKFWWSAAEGIPCLLKSRFAYRQFSCSPTGGTVCLFQVFMFPRWRYAFFPQKSVRVSSLSLPINFDLNLIQISNLKAPWRHKWKIELKNAFPDPRMQI